MNMHNNTKIGWICSAALLGILAATAFQGPTEKFGVVDISKVVEQSDFGRANQDAFKKMKAARESVLEFIDQNRVLTNEQALRLRDLTIKDPRTADESAELDRIKAQVVASSKASSELSTRANMTPDERTLLEGYSRQSQAMEQLEQRWFQGFTKEMQDWADKQKIASVEKARAAIQDVAKVQGYSLVFEVGIAPYGANDLTEPVLKAMNAKK